MRRLLILLLCLLLPWQGLALAHAPEPPCPMAQTQAADDEHGAGHDCCADDEGSDAGRRCKPGQECSGGSHMLPARALPPLFAQPAESAAGASLEIRDLFRPDGVWRPPTLG